MDTGYILNDEVIGWDINKLRKTIVSHEQIYEIRTTTTNFGILIDEIWLEIGKHLSIRDILTLAGLSRKRCPTILSGYILNYLMIKFVHKTIHKEIDTTPTKLRKSYTQITRCFDPRDIDEILSWKYFKTNPDEQFIMANLDHFVNNEYMLERSYITKLGQFIIKALDPEQLIGYYCHNETTVTLSLKENSVTKTVKKFIKGNDDIRDIVMFIYEHRRHDYIMYLHYYRGYRSLTHIYLALYLDHPLLDNEYLDEYKQLNWNDQNSFYEQIKNAQNMRPLLYYAKL